MPLQDLYRATKRRQKKAFRPGTLNNHRCYFETYIHFCMHHGLADINPSTDTICMYAEFLARRFKSPKSVKNYISGVRLLHKYVSVEAPALRSFELDLMIRALDLTMGHTPQQRLPVNLSMLKQICDICDTLGSIGLTFKFAFLAVFFWFSTGVQYRPSHR